MRTRSGSLAAVLARVPSHPAHSGMLCICTANASSRSGSRRRIPRLQQAEGQQALQLLIGGFANTALGWRSNFSAIGASFNVGVGAGSLVLNSADANTAVGTAALLLNSQGGRNTAVGAAAMVFNTGALTGEGSFNGAFGAFALNSNDGGFSNNAVGDSALFRNII